MTEQIYNGSVGIKKDELKRRKQEQKVRRKVEKYEEDNFEREILLKQEKRIMVYERKRKRM